MSVAYSQIHNNNNHLSCLLDTPHNYVHSEQKRKKIIGSPCYISSHVQIMVQILLKIKIENNDKTKMLSGLIRYKIRASAISSAWQAKSGRTRSTACATWCSSDGHRPPEHTTLLRARDNPPLHTWTTVKRLQRTPAISRELNGRCITRRLTAAVSTGSP